MTGTASSPHMRKAEGALGAAQLLLRSGDADGACNRAYCAIFEAAYAALCAAGVPLPQTPMKSNRGLVGLFGQHLVRTKKIDAKQGAALNQVVSLFLLANYEHRAVGLDKAARAVELTASFVAAIKATFLL